MAGIHRSLNLAVAAIGLVVVAMTAVHFITSIGFTRLGSAFAVAVLGGALILRLLRQTS